MFVENGGDEGEGLRGLLVARVCLLFTFYYDQKRFWCALVEWFLQVTDEPDDVTGMWIVAPEEDQQGRRVRNVVALDTILRPAHLIALYGENMVPVNFHFADTLDAFHAYYVNKYIDHHAHTLGF